MSKSTPNSDIDMPTTGLLFTSNVEALVSNAFFSQVYGGIASAAADHERHILGYFGTCTHPDRLRACVLESPALGAVDSLITLELFDRDILAAAASQRPVVCVDAAMHLSGVSSISFDHDASLAMAFDYLLAAGHRRIGFVGQASGSDPAVAARRSAFEQQLGRVDVPSKEGLLFLVHDRTRVGDLVKQYLGQPKDLRPTALIVIDNTFWGFLFALIAAGLKVPGDLSLVNVGVVQTWPDMARHAMRMRGKQRQRWEGVVPVPEHYSNEPAALSALRPTTVHLPANDMGRWAVEELVRRVAGGEPSHDVLGPELVEGNTTAAPAAGAMT